MAWNNISDMNSSRKPYYNKNPYWSFLTMKIDDWLISYCSPLIIYMRLSLSLFFIVSKFKLIIWSNLIQLAWSLNTATDNKCRSNKDFWETLNIINIRLFSLPYPHLVLMSSTTDNAIELSTYKIPLIAFLPKIVSNLIINIRKRRFYSKWNSFWLERIK